MKIEFTLSNKRYILAPLYKTKKVYLSNENGIYMELLKYTYQLLSKKQKKDI